MPRGTYHAVQVIVHDSGSGPVSIVMGGYLPHDEAWIPSNLIDVDGDYYLPLSKRDRKLSSFCGTVLACNKLIDSLLEKRNEQCSRILRALASEGEVIQDIDANLKFAKKRFSMQAPKTIVLTVPSLLDPASFVCIPVVFESDAKVSCAVKVSTDVMDYICNAISGSDAGDRGKKRPRDDRICSGFKEVLYNYSRGSFYVVYCDADGRKHTKHAKPICDRLNTEEEKQQAMKECAQGLQEFYVDNHHVQEEVTAA